MTKEDLYTAIESENERSLSIANELKELEQQLADGSITQQVFEMSVIEIRDIRTLQILIGEDLTIANVINLCNILLGNS